jgi:polyferredoxin
MTTIPSYRWKRRLAQLATLTLIALVPASGLLRIDLASASFFILSRQISWSSSALVFGLTLVFVTVPVLTYISIGSVWCGWACPQNLLTEWANNLTYKLLGKRAKVEMGKDELIVAAAKNRLVNWAILGSSLLAMSLLLALIPMLFFYTPAEVREMVTYSDPEKLSPLIIYLIIAFLVFIDIAFLRYFVCDYVCFYRMGQRIFQTRDALHVSYDETRSADCAKCNYCATACITGIQPTEIKRYDSCINCGECIDACGKLHQKSGTPGLLSFESSSRPASTTWQQRIGGTMLKNWLAVTLFLAGVAMMAWGVETQPRELPKIPLAVQQKAREVERVCNLQCAQQQAACKNHSMEGCYRAAACRCECSLQQDPANAAGDEWRQCAATNWARARAENARAADPGSAKIAAGVRQ